MRRAVCRSMVGAGSVRTNHLWRWRGAGPRAAGEVGASGQQITTTNRTMALWPADSALGSALLLAQD